MNKKKSLKKKRRSKDGSKKIGRFTITRVSEKDSILKSLYSLSKISINLNIEDFPEYKKLVKNYNTKNIDILIKKIINTDFCEQKNIKKNIDIFKEKYINKLLELQNELKFESPKISRSSNNLSPIFEEDEDDIVLPFLSSKSSYDNEPYETDTIKNIKKFKHAVNPNKSRVLTNNFVFDIEDVDLSRKDSSKKSPKSKSSRKKIRLY